MKKILLILAVIATTISCNKNDDDTPRQEGAPFAVDDAADTQSNLAVTIDVLSNDRDGDNPIDKSTLKIITNATNGITSVNTSEGKITYNPNPEFAGIDTFKYEICDNGDPSLCSSATVTITVQGIDEPRN